MKTINKLIEKLKDVWRALTYCPKACLECAFCPYYTRCEQEVEKPENNEDGSCKQRDIYKREKER